MLNHPYDPNDINKKAQTALLLDYLEVTVADEMILNSFIRDMIIMDVTSTIVTIGVSSQKSKEIFKTDINNLVKQGIEQIFEKQMEVEIILKTDTLITDHEKRVITSKSINEKYTFDNYVTSDFNKETVNIAQKIVKKPGFFTPVYISSASGLGKSHLLQAIGNSYVKKGFSTIYIEPNQFTRKIHALSTNKDGSIADYTDELLKFDVLLFDDIQNLGDREVTLKVLFNIIEEALKKEKQIVISSDKVAEELSGFEPRFITRFKSGLSTTIKHPEISDLVKVLEFKLDKEGMSPSKWEDEAIRFIARNNSTSIRALEGAIKRVVFYTENESNIKYTYSVISAFFKELSIDPSELTPTRILNVVAGYYKITKANMISKSRKREFVVARHMAIYLIRRITKLSYVEIGKIMGGRDHSTIMSGNNKIDQMIKINKAVKLAADRIESKIKKIT